MNREWKKRVVIAGVSIAVCFTFTGCGTQTVSDLSLKEIKNIYDGKIKDWSEL